MGGDNVGFKRKLVNFAKHLGGGGVWGVTHMLVLREIL